MSSRVERAQKQTKEKHQSILNELLREDANRFCADCEAKGPRWASWNIGVFMCIRCAGIHRNLGVHISKVKSVNLDSWTQEQIENVQTWGNKRAKEYYECYLPEDFVRPQGDSAMESFIRNKYERKLYMRKGGVPPAASKAVQKDKENKAPAANKKKDKEPERKPQQNTILNVAKNNTDQTKTSTQQPTNTAVPRPHASTSVTTKTTNEAPLVDLLMDDQNSAAAQPVKQSQNDEFNLFMTASAPVTNTAVSNQSPAFTQPTMTVQSQGGNDALIFEESKQAPGKTTKGVEQSWRSWVKITANQSMLLSMIQSPPPYQHQLHVQLPGQTGFDIPNDIRFNEEIHTLTIESILSLYQSGNQQQRMYGVPGGVYVSPQQQQQPQQQQFGNPNMRMAQPQFGMQQHQVQMQQMMQLQQQMQQMQLRQGMGNQMQMNQMNQMRMRGQQSSYGPGMQTTGSFGSMQQQYPTSGFTGLMGQNYMANSSWGANRPMMPSQPPIMVNGPGMGYNIAPLASSPTTGHTLSHQLWN